MEIDNMEDVLKLLESTKDFFINVESTEKKLTNDLLNKELEFEDIRHEIELSELSAIEIMKVYKQEKKILIERRKIKDKLALINTIKGYANKFIEKGICADTDTTIKNIKTLKSNQEVRCYTPRILKDLKCAKKSKAK